MSGSESVVVIGTGAAGRSAAKALAASGHQVTVVERDRVGGTCLWRGCIPKKALYVAARAVRDARRARQYRSRVRRHPRRLVRRSSHGSGTPRSHSPATKKRCLWLAASDCSVAAHDSCPRPQSLSMTKCFRRTTSCSRRVRSPSSSTIPGAELADTSDDALRFPTPPRSLIIVGGGFIAMEMAGIFASFGTQVQVVERGPRVLSMLDESLARVATSRLAEMGVCFHMDSSAARNLRHRRAAVGTCGPRWSKRGGTRLRASHLRHRTSPRVRRPRSGEGRNTA